MEVPKELYQTRTDLLLGGRRRSRDSSPLGKAPLRSAFASPTPYLVSSSLPPLAVLRRGHCVLFAAHNVRGVLHLLTAFARPQAAYLCVNFAPCFGYIFPTVVHVSLSLFMKAAPVSTPSLACRSAPIGHWLVCSATIRLTSASHPVPHFSSLILPRRLPNIGGEGAPNFAFPTSQL